MNIDIRPATVVDALAIANIFTTSITTLGSADYTEEQIAAIVKIHNAESYLEEIEDNSVIILVAEAGTEVVGFGSVEKNGRTIGDLFVLPDHTRQGIGTLLLNALEAIALKKRVSKLRVMASLTARPFYLSRGFQYAKDSALIDAETGIKVPCVDMTKVISHKSNFKEKNLEDYEDLSTFTVPLVLNSGVKILLGSSN